MKQIHGTVTCDLFVSLVSVVIRSTVKNRNTVALELFWIIVINRTNEYFQSVVTVRRPVLCCESFRAITGQ